MSVKFSRLLWLFSLFFLLSLTLTSQRGYAAPEAIAPSPFAFPAVVTADDTNSITVNLTNVTTLTTTVALSLVDATTGVAPTNGAAATSFESNSLIALTPTGTSQVTFHQVKIATPSGVGQYKLRLVTTAGTVDLSTPFSVISGKLQSVSITAGPTPTTATAGSLFTLSGKAADAEGNPVSGATVAAALFVAGAATLTDADAAPVTTDATGAFTFSKLAINKIGTYTLTVTATTAAPAASASSAPSAPITITPGAPQLTFTTQPGNAQSGAPLFAVVHLQDGSGNVLSGTGVSVALSGGTGTLAGTSNVNTDSNGNATFSNLSVNKVGTNYQLTASAPGITPAPATTASIAFAITTGPAAAISFVQQPATTPAGSAITPATTVLVTDAGGNPLGAAAVTVNLLGGATLSGTTSQNTGTTGATLGVASFNDLKVSAPGTYQLTANTGSLSITSSIFNVTAGAPTALVFGQPPTGTASGAIINPPVTVLLKDGSGNLTTSTAAVTLSIAAGSPAGAVLGGTTTVNAVNGVATFADLHLDKTGSYTLTASATSAVPAVTPVTSGAFSVTAGRANTISFTAAPTGTVAGAVINSPGGIVVAVKDVNGNPVPGVSVTLTPTTGTINGTATIVTDTNGSAAFTDLSVDKAGTIKLLASVAGVAPITSSAFTISAGSAATLAFTTQPATTTAAGVVINNPGGVVVTATDALGNPVSGTGVTLALTGGTGTLTGTTTVNTDSNGNAVFSALSISKAGNGYVLTASAPGVLPTAPAAVNSNAFTISAGSTKTLAFTIQPAASTVSGAVLKTPGGVVVTATDAQGNPVSGVTVQIALSTGTFTPTSTTTISTDGNGKATFSNLSVDKVGTGYTLTATAPGVLPTAPTPVASNAFAITQGAPAAVSFIQQPTSASAGAAIAPPVTVAVTDAGGNPVSNAPVNLTLSGGTGTLTGVASAHTDATGMATFSTLSIDKTGSSYVLTAATNGATSVNSNPFAITSGILQLTFAAQPTTDPTKPASIASGANIPVKVHLQDGSGNVLSGVSVTLALSGGTGVLAGTASVNTDSNGDATFSTLSVDKVGAGYTLTATAPSVLPAAPAPITSNPFAITQGAPAAVSFIQQPTSASAGAAIAPPVTVAVTDAAGNPVSGVPINLTLSGGIGTLTGTNPVNTDATGTATFSTLSIDKTGSSYVLTAATNGAAPASSNLFAITPGTPQLTFAAQPTTDLTKPASIASGANIPVKVHLQDGSGNVLAGQSVTLSATPNPFTSTSTVTVSTDGNGDATFSNLSISPAAPAYTITAAASGVLPTAPTAITSNPFAVVPGAVSVVTFTTQPTNIAATPPNTLLRSVIAPAVVVTVTDAAGNPVPQQNVQMTLAPGSAGTLTGTTPQATDAQGNATFNDLSIDTPGTKQLAATVTAGTVRTQTTSNSFQVGNLPSTISSLSNIGNIHAGDPAFTLIINGSNFVVPTTNSAGSTVTFTDINPVTGNVETTPLTLTGTPTSTIITALVPAALIAEAQTATVTVINPAGITTGTLTPAVSSFPILPLGPSADVNAKPHANEPDGQPQQYFNAGLQMFSVPFDYTLDDSGHSLLVGGILGAFQISLNPASGTVTHEDVLPRLAIWDPLSAAYLMTSTATAPVITDGLSADNLVLGQGYWGRFQYQPSTDPTRQTGLLARGLEAAELTDVRKLDGQHRFAIALHAGWNMIGDPFTGPVNLRDLQVPVLNPDGTSATLSLTDASTQGYVSATFYKYDPASGYIPVAVDQGDNTLRPYLGYWVHAYQACTLLVPQP